MSLGRLRDRLWKLLYDPSLPYREEIPLKGLNKIVGNIAAVWRVG